MPWSNSAYCQWPQCKIPKTNGIRGGKKKQLKTSAASFIPIHLPAYNLSTYWANLDSPEYKPDLQERTLRTRPLTQLSAIPSTNGPEDHMDPNLQLYLETPRDSTFLCLLNYQQPHPPPLHGTTLSLKPEAQSSHNTESQASVIWSTTWQIEVTAKKNPSIYPTNMRPDIHNQKHHKYPKSSYLHPITETH